MASASLFMTAHLSTPLTPTHSTIHIPPISLALSTATGTPAMIYLHRMHMSTVATELVPQWDLARFRLAKTLTIQPRHTRAPRRAGQQHLPRPKWTGDKCTPNARIQALTHSLHS
ncbi:hypothetical protein FIBSPDRAFT_950001 [Athelia psychrophila]|uniref:Uncharacterized protein n=1 Tax=Athelia psychrophila TaxID=1759441 RepID=A0A166PAA7_9AGAM|nr:hypothetical protein FIBSPDRAFT_950001 [Fibularhizoctonia sp. CBS 109695]